jgi:hypothetical protein
VSTMLLMFSTLLILVCLPVMHTAVPGWTLLVLLVLYCSRVTLSYLHNIAAPLVHTAATLASTELLQASTHPLLCSYYWQGQVLLKLNTMH